MGNAYGDTRPSLLENDEHDNLIKAKRVTTWPDNTQQQVDYVARTDGQPVYIGYAIRGLATSDAGWMIQKFTYTTIGGNDYLASRQIAYDSWSNRASATYA